MGKYEDVLERARQLLMPGTPRMTVRRTVFELFPELKENKKSLYNRMKDMEVGQEIQIEDNPSRRNTAQNYASLLRHYSGVDIKIRRGVNCIRVIREG